MQLAKVLEAAEVVGVCGTKNAELVKSLECDPERISEAGRIIDYKHQDFTQENIRYDIVLDVIGNRTFDDCKRVLQPQGYYVTTQPYPVNFAQSFLTFLLPGQKYRIIMLRSSAPDLVFLKEQIEAGHIRSIIDRTYPLAEVAAAHAYGETERTVGKVVITIAS